jgi:hypothetical protein
MTRDICCEGMGTAEVEQENNPPNCGPHERLKVQANV